MIGKRLLFLTISGILTIGTLLISGCGKTNDALEPETINKLWEDQALIVYENLIFQEAAPGEGKIAEGIETFARKLDALVPRINKTYEQYNLLNESQETNSEDNKAKENSDIISVDRKSMSPEEEERYRAMVKLTAVSVFTKNFADINVAKFKNVPAAQEALKKLESVKGKILLPESFEKNSDVAEMLNKLVTGKMKGGKRVEVFFSRMRRASVTSRFKVSMQRMFILGQAIEAFKKEHGFAPIVSELSQLNSYRDFVPKFIKKVPLEDGWGNYFYYKAEGESYWIGCAGTDETFRGFNQKGFYVDTEQKNIILSNGRFTLALTQKKKEDKDEAIGSH